MRNPILIVSREYSDTTFIVVFACNNHSTYIPVIAITVFKRMPMSGTGYEPSGFNRKGCSRHTLIRSQRIFGHIDTCTIRSELGTRSSILQIIIIPLPSDAGSFIPSSLVVHFIFISKDFPAQSFGIVRNQVCLLSNRFKSFFRIYFDSLDRFAI